MPPGGKSKKKQLNELLIPREIERKFIVAERPAILDSNPEVETVEIRQGYISVSKDDNVVRVREEAGSEGVRYTLAVKGPGDKDREETEGEISKALFESLWATTKGRHVNKTRYKIPREGAEIDFDIYKDDLEGLMTAEVEFDSLEEADEFFVPEWFSLEVTADQAYKNVNLAIHGLPKEATGGAIVPEDEPGIPRYNLEKGITLIIRSIEFYLNTRDTVIVAVAGGSASGKTSAVSQAIKQHFGIDSVMLSLDDYYKGKRFMSGRVAKGDNLNWDQPEAVDMALARLHLSRLKTGAAVNKPVYSMKSGEREGYEPFEPQKVVIVEGLFALNDEIKSEADVKVFVDIGTHGRILRRLLRDVERTGQRPVDILNRFASNVEPMHEKHVVSTRNNADFIINNEYGAEVEAERSGLHEVQLKFRSTLDPELLRHLGAERLGTVYQVDHYYNPKDRNLIETGEILRIREESGHRILTYKGSKIDSRVHERPKFEFEIDEETEQKFLGIYGRETKTIEKVRALYQLDGVVLSLDQVGKRDGRELVNLGSFVEIRSTGGKHNSDHLNTVLDRLQLELEKGTKESYFEM
ncbi:MAG: Uridine kinase [bacterium ADurb.Bin400]|nr:MAG: Uridine kinase [bacterium ADurb.Bin400]